MPTLRASILTATLAVVCVAFLTAQQPSWDARRVQMSRDSLQALLGRLEDAARSNVYSSKLRTRSAFEAALIRGRLDEGDFNVGDRVALRVEGQTAMTDTFAVEPGRVLVIPEVGTVPLAGVLRAELLAHLTLHVGRVVSNPVVQARSLIRLAILGEVARPGYYTLPVETLVDDALMRASGPTGLAQLNGIRIERGRTVLWEGDEVSRAITEGRTLNALSVRAGDTIFVPKTAARDWFSIMRTVGMVASLPFTILGLVRLF